ncbi:MAG: Lpg1974 family pore-forming outer membrane protein [Parachlamydiales bacterium]
MLEKSLKAIPLIAASLFTSTALFGFAHAPLLSQVSQPMQQTDSLTDLENKVSQLEEKKANNRMGVTQPSRPELRDEVSFIIEGYGLYWKAEQEGMEYAVKSPDPFASGVMHKGKLLTHDFDWNGGFRVGIGLHLPYDSWELKALWTRYCNSSTVHHHTSNPDFSPTFFSLPNVAWFATHAKSHYSIEYNTVDATLQRDYFVSRSLTLRPIFGVRGAWIDQHFSQHFHGGPGGIGLFGPATGTQKVHVKNDFWGAGIFGGINLNFCFNRQWSIYGDLAGSLLWGHFDVKVKNRITGVNISGAHPSGNVKSETSNLKANVQTGLGLQWQTTFSKSRYRLLFSAGYEILFWFSQNNAPRFVFPGTLNNGYYESNGSLTLQGGTFRGLFEF